MRLALLTFAAAFAIAGCGPTEGGSPVGEKASSGKQNSGKAITVAMLPKKNFKIKFWKTFEENEPKNIKRKEVQYVLK